jgi:hypothetical protein
MIQASSTPNQGLLLHSNQGNQSNSTYCPQMHASPAGTIVTSVVGRQSRIIPKERKSDFLEMSPRKMSPRKMAGRPSFAILFKPKPETIDSSLSPLGKCHQFRRAVTWKAVNRYHFSRGRRLIRAKATSNLDRKSDSRSSQCLQLTRQNESM